MIRKKRKHFLKQFLTNKIRVAEFGITNCCTAKCTFCGIWKQKEKRIVDRETGIKAIDKLAELGVAHITLTGGDPLLNPAVYDLVRHCSAKHIHTNVLNADARLLTDENVGKLADAGADFLCISVDSHDPEVVEKSRGIPGLFEHIENGVKLAKKHKISTMAAVLIWTGNYDRLDQHFAKLHKMGFDYIAVNYPEISQSKVYPLGGETVQIKPELVSKALADVIKMKKSKKYRIMNTVSSMENIRLYLDHPDKVKFHCYGGYRVLFLDWFYNVYPCMHLPDPIGSLWDMKNSDFKKVKCNKCNMSWYRDFSVYFHGLSSIRPVLETVSMFNHISRVKK